MISNSDANKIIEFIGYDWVIESRPLINFINSLVEKEKIKEYCGVCGRMMITDECIKAPHSSLETGEFGP